MILLALIRRAFAFTLHSNNLYKLFCCFEINSHCVQCLCGSAAFILQPPFRSAQSIWGCVGVNLSECFCAVHTYPGKAYSHLYHNVTSTRYQFKGIESTLSSANARKINIFVTYKSVISYSTSLCYIYFSRKKTSSTWNKTALKSNFTLSKDSIFQIDWHWGKLPRWSKLIVELSYCSRKLSDNMPNLVCAELLTVSVVQEYYY